MSTTVYHTSEFQRIHDGPKATCVDCNKKKLPREVKSKKTGSTGGKKSSGRRRRPPRRCGGCKKPIHRQSKSGLCLRCLKEKRVADAVKKKKKKAKVRRCDCGNKLAPSNKTGLCRECWSKSPETKANRQKVQGWVNAAVFSRNATTRGSTDAP
jgi:hypothetical protein